MKTVNFGIDLGTTNSMIACYQNGNLEVFKNPLGLKATLASAVAYRKNRTLIGDKAREFSERDPLNVFTCFKRKMGTSDRYWVPNREAEVNPIDLSSQVLMELKNFIHTGEKPSEVVVTIPASFDTIQSNATKLAGEKAGFKEVHLLQEPIAASLAFANRQQLDLSAEKRWLVYDFGGGTFDVALLKIDDREIDVLDNAGDNFLGGLDIDNTLVEQVLIPVLEKALGVPNLWEECRKKEGKYKTLYYELLYKAEEAKKELSVFDKVEIELEYDDEDVYETVEISRDQFNQLIRPLVQRTLEFTKSLLMTNGLTADSIDRILLVGGTTMIPYVKTCLENEFGIALGTEVAPTEAVGIGAAYFAGTKPKKHTEDTEESQHSALANAQEFELVYERSSRDEEELIHLTALSDFNGFYRIKRRDGGFDTGSVAFSKEAFVYVDLLQRELNTFELLITDADQQEVFKHGAIIINQGKYQVKGQVLPIDICLEIDDLTHGVTRLEPIFAKNSLLPLKRMVYKTLSKSILKDSDDSLRINIVEGSSVGLPSSGLTIGFVEISGKALKADLIKGTDIELEITLSESRDLKVDVYLNFTEQEFKNNFTPSERYLEKSELDRDLGACIYKLEQELNVHEDDYEFLAKIKHIKDELIELQIALTLAPDDDVSDTKYSIDNQKRKLMNDFDLLTRQRALNDDLTEYRCVKASVQAELNEEANESYRHQFEKIIADEKTVLNSGNKYLIKAKVKEMESLLGTLFNADDRNFIDVFISYKMNSEQFTDSIKADRMFEEGDRALEQQDYRRLKSVVYQLFSLLPREDKDKSTLRKSDQTGLQ